VSYFWDKNNTVKPARSGLFKSGHLSEADTFIKSLPPLNASRPLKNYYLHNATSVHLFQVPIDLCCRIERTPCCLTSHDSPRVYCVRSFRSQKFPKLANSGYLQHNPGSARWLFYSFLDHLSSVIGLHDLSTMSWGPFQLSVTQRTHHEHPYLAKLSSFRFPFTYETANGLFLAEGWWLHLHIFLCFHYFWKKRFCHNGFDRTSN
jgi:hypothetical protein